MLYPEVKVGGRITKANQLSSTAEIREEGFEKLATILYNVYSVSLIVADGAPLLEEVIVHTYALGVGGKSPGASPT